MPTQLIDKILNNSEKLWIETIYLKSKSNENFNERTLRVELHSNLEKEFNPQNIDHRLLRNKTKLTLIGTVLINPKSYMADKADKVIKTINNLIKSDADTQHISSEEISQTTKISEKDVQIILFMLSETGLYHSHGLTGEGSDTLSSITIDENALRGYLEYPNLNDCLAQVAEDIYYAKKVVILEKEDKSSKLENMADVQKTATKSKNVFIVHGQDNEAKETVARFIARLNLEPIILHEQTSGGKTIIEKFEHHSNDVGYAVVLLTPDDVGNAKNKSDDLQPRARQNVIFELGYFFAKLKRENVCALYKEGVEIPSDIYGVVYAPMDSGGAWKIKLAQEMKQAGLDIDMNRI